MTEFNDFMNSLIDEPIEASKADTRKKFPCGQCAGTGQWRQRRPNRHGDSHCFSCKGKGYFLTDPRKLAQARDRRAASKERKIAEAQIANEATPLFKWVRENSSWNSFCSSLVQQHYSGRAWSENQLAAVSRMKEKTEATLAAKEAAREAQRVEVDLSAIFELFETAKASGYKKPSFRAEGLCIKPATGRNAGGLYVLNDNEHEVGDYGPQRRYEGKLVDGVFTGRRGVDDSVLDSLVTIAANPLEAALSYGRLTGTCSCCGRELTKHASIADGIGPICKAKWGL